jgi:DNA ligase 1
LMLVVEIALDGVQSSTRYPGRVALRLARVKGYRPDKPADEADAIDDLRAVLGDAGKRSSGDGRRAGMGVPGARRATRPR